jgi:alcohol dehydrogenase
MKIRGAVLDEPGRERPYARSRPITISELELDAPVAGEILVRIEAAGICHSDLSVVNGSRERPVPMLLGHEASGIVELLGEGVTDLEVGDRVSMTFLPRCGECGNCLTDGRLPCTVGSNANNAGTLMNGGKRLHRNGESVLHHLGVSGFATHAVVDRRSVVRVGADVPPDIAAVLGCAVLTGGGALMNSGRPRAGDAVIVVGLGGVGVAALITAVSLGYGDVIGVDAIPEKLVTAKRLGATAAYTPDEALSLGVKAAVVVEAAGHPRAFETAVLLKDQRGYG